jgi:hypothetical protein
MSRTRGRTAFCLRQLHDGVVEIEELVDNLGVLRKTETTRTYIGDEVFGPNRWGFDACEGIGVDVVVNGQGFLLLELLFFSLIVVFSWGTRGSLGGSSPLPAALLCHFGGLLCFFRCEGGLAPLNASGLRPGACVRSHLFLFESCN